MTGVKTSTLQALRLQYNAALAAQQGCMRALIEASMAGTLASAALVEREARARQELDRARERLLAAMTEAITGEAAAERSAGPRPPKSAERPEGTSS
jgi:uncharacterized protein involved in exopolysaccharide biosynthesis